jgi:predicted RNA polymerase sigma factor
MDLFVVSLSGDEKERNHLSRDCLEHQCIWTCHTKIPDEFIVFVIPRKMKAWRILQSNLDVEYISFPDIRSISGSHVEYQKQFTLPQEIIRLNRIAMARFPGTSLHLKPQKSLPLCNNL